MYAISEVCPSYLAINMILENMYLSHPGTTNYLQFSETLDCPLKNTGWPLGLVNVTRYDIDL